MNNLTDGFVRSSQIMDTTGLGASSESFFTTGNSDSAWAFFVVDEQGIQPIEPIDRKLASIREKSHRTLGAAWSRLAQM